MDLSLAELRAFLETARIGTISAAARSLGIKQPTLSWTVRRLEERLDAELFIRGKKGVTLTRAGELLVTRARELLRQWEHIERDLRAEKETVRGTYSIGVYPALAAYALPRFLPDLLARWPDLQIDIGHDFSQQIAGDVVALRYDLGIVVNPPRHPDLTIVDLYADEVKLWRAKGTKWQLDQPRVPVVCNPNMTQVPPLLAEIRSRGLLPEFRFVKTTDLQVIASLTAAGCGLGILPSTIAYGESGGGLLMPLRRTPVIHDQIALIWRRDAQHSLASKVIREAIRTTLQVANGA